MTALPGLPSRLSGGLLQVFIPTLKLTAKDYFLSSETPLKLSTSLRIPLAEPQLIIPSAHCLGLGDTLSRSGHGRLTAASARKIRLRRYRTKAKSLSIQAQTQQRGR